MYKGQTVENEPTVRPRIALPINAIIHVFSPARGMINQPIVAQTAVIMQVNLLPRRLIGI